MKTTLQFQGGPLELENLVRKGNGVSFALHGKTYHFRGEKRADGSFTLEEETAPGISKHFSGTAAAGGKGAMRIHLAGLEAKISQAQSGASTASTESVLSPRAPMPGMVRQVMVKKGDTVSKGQAVAILEAMKLQMTLTAGGDGFVAAVLAKPGDRVAEGAELLTIDPA